MTNDTPRRRYQIRIGKLGTYHMCGCGSNLFYRPEEEEPNSYKCYQCDEPYIHDPEFTMCDAPKRERP